MSTSEINVPSSDRDREHDRRLLTALHEVMVQELLPAIGNARAQELGMCVVRLLARMRLGLQEVAVSETESLGMPDTVAPAANLALAERGSAQAFAMTVDAVVHRLERLQSVLPDVHTTSAGTAEPRELEQRLSQYLESRFPELPRPAVRNWRVVPGGRVKLTALFSVGHSASLPERLVLRQDMAASTTGTSVTAEAPLLQLLHSSGLPVPRPVLAEADTSVLGGGFVIMTEVPGSRAGELFAELNDLTRLHPKLVHELASVLARVHRLRSIPGGPSLPGSFDPGAATDDLVRKFAQGWHGLPKPRDSIATELGFSWLLANPLPPGRPSCVVHGDVGLHNILVEEGHLSALLDWELARVGDPAEDIGYCLAPVLRPLIQWPEFVAEYTAAGGDVRACDPRAVAYYSVWGHVRNSYYTAYLADQFFRGVRGDVEAANAGVDFFARCQLYIARELHAALRTVPGP